MKKILTVMCAFALLFASGCGAGGDKSGFEPTMDASESVVINVNGSWANFEALEAVAADWNVIYPNAEISYSRVDGYNSALYSLVSSDNAPDIVVFGTGDYYENKDLIVENLTDLDKIGMNTEIFDDSVIENSAVDGKLCSLSWGVRAPGFAVNNTLLKSLGLSVPQTHDEFIKVCTVLKEHGYTPIQGCSESFYKLIMKNESDFRIFGSDDSADVRRALSVGAADCGAYFWSEFAAMLDIADAGFTDPTVNDGIADIYEANILHFFKGETPFLCFNTEGFSGMKKRETKSESFSKNPFEYSFVSLPVCSDEPLLCASAFGSLALVENSKNALWAQEFMRFLCSRENINKMAETKGVPSVLGDGGDIL